LSRPTTQGQVAAAKVADDGIDGIGSEEQVKLGVKRVAKEQFDDDLLVLDLTGQAAEANFIFVGGGTDCQLFAEILGKLFLQPKSGLIVDVLVVMSKPHRGAEFLDGRPVHAHEQSVAIALAPGPALDKAVELLPAAQIEVADAKVRVVGHLQGLLQGRKKVLFNVVENPRHGESPFQSVFRSLDQMRHRVQPRTKRVGTDNGFGGNSDGRAYSTVLACRPQLC